MKGRFQRAINSRRMVNARGKAFMTWRLLSDPASGPCECGLRCKIAICSVIKTHWRSRQGPSDRKEAPFGRAARRQVMHPWVVMAPSHCPPKRKSWNDLSTLTALHRLVPFGFRLGPRIETRYLIAITGVTLCPPRCLHGRRPAERLSQPLIDVRVCGKIHMPHFRPRQHRGDIQI